MTAPTRILQVTELSVPAVNDVLRQIRDLFDLMSGSTVATGDAYDTIQDEGSALTARDTLNFVGAALTAADDAGNARTNVTLSQSPSSGSVVSTGRTISTTSPLAGGGDLSANRTLSITSPLPIANGGTNNASAYTAGSIIFSDGTKLTQNNSNLSWSNSNLSLGIGTTAKSNIDLDVQGTGDRDVARFTRYSAADDESPNTQLSLRAARGTSASPLATLADDELGAFNFKGYTGSAFTGTMAGFVGVATQTTTPTAQGAKLEFRVTPNDTTGYIVGMIVQHGGAVCGCMDTMTYAAAISLDVDKGNLHKTTTIHATGNATINASSGGIAGQHLWVLVVNDATAAKTITFGTNFKPSATVVGTASKGAAVHFVSDSTSWWEVARTLGL